MKRRLTHAYVSSPKLTRPLTLAVVADLHNAPFEEVLPLLRQADGILLVGDLVNRHREGFAEATAFLAAAPKCAPTFYSLGNHERKFKQLDAYWQAVQKSDVTVLDNDFVPFGGITLGGLSSKGKMGIEYGFLAEMAAEGGFRLLMCHHPEYYGTYTADFDIDLTIAGHAHGGQIELFGRGLYAPGQGLLPKRTHGFYENGRLLVSRGMTNSSGCPRWFNPCELILLHLTPGMPSHALEDGGMIDEA